MVSFALCDFVFEAREMMLRLSSIAVRFGWFTPHHGNGNLYLTVLHAEGKSSS